MEIEPIERESEKEGDECDGYVLEVINDRVEGGVKEGHCEECKSQLRTVDLEYKGHEAVVASRGYSICKPYSDRLLRASSLVCLQRLWKTRKLGPRKKFEFSGFERRLTSSTSNFHPQPSVPYSHV